MLWIDPLLLCPAWLNGCSFGGLRRLGCFTAMSITIFTAVREILATSTRSNNR